jgi:hypothetical protein
MCYAGRAVRRHHTKESNVTTHPRWTLARLGTLLVLALASLATVSTALAGEDQAQDRRKNRPRTDEPAAWSDPRVAGTVTNTFWAEGKDPGTKTATLVVWHADGDIAVTIYGDDPAVRQAIVDGTACVGRYVVVVGDRIDEDELVGRSIEVPDQSVACEWSLQ